jgi:hypothetical protein
MKATAEPFMILKKGGMGGKGRGKSTYSAVQPEGLTPSDVEHREEGSLVLTELLKYFVCA